MNEGKDGGRKELPLLPKSEGPFPSSYHCRLGRGLAAARQLK